MAAVAFSATAGLEPPLRNLITFAKAGASFSAKQLCSSVLMAGMDPEQVLKEDLAAGQGMIHTRIKPNAGRVEASALFGLIRACLLYTSPSPRDGLLSRMPSSA